MDSVNGPEMFLKYDYAETKDLLKTFITLISATLVLSITLSEKIVDVHKANSRVKKMMVLSWSFYVLALVGCGASMCFIAVEAGCVLYGGVPFIQCRYGMYAMTSWILVVLSGTAYVVGLLLMLLSARAKMTEAENQDPSLQS
jgi:hypothetical protein